MQPAAMAIAAGNCQRFEDCLIRTRLHIVSHSESREQQREDFCGDFLCTCNHTAELFAS